MTKKERGAPQKALTCNLRKMEINETITIKNRKSNTISPYCAYVQRQDGYKFKTTQINEDSVVKRIA